MIRIFLIFVRIIWILLTQMSNPYSPEQGVQQVALIHAVRSVFYSMIRALFQASLHLHPTTNQATMAKSSRPLPCPQFFETLRLRDIDQ